MTRIKRFTQRYKILIVSIIFLSLYSGALFVFAAGPFLPSDNILDPGCAPTDLTCYVNTSTTPAGSNGYVQFNNSGAFGASSHFVWDNVTNRLGINTTPSYTVDISGIAQITGRLLLRQSADENNIFIGGGNLTATGTDNTEVGSAALFQLSSGSRNTAVGIFSSFGLTGGTDNVSIGAYSLPVNQNGIGNVAVGAASLSVATGNQNTAIGRSALSGVSSGEKNIGVGYLAGTGITTGSNNIVIGNEVDVFSATSNNQLNIGNLIYGSNLDGTGPSVSTGNIGIGVQNPSYRLEVTSPSLSYVTDNRTASFSTGSTFDTTFGILKSYSGYFTSTSTRATGAFALENIGIYASASGAQNNYAAIFDQGSVGIGTNNPNAKLDIQAGYGNNALTVAGRTQLDNIGAVPTNILLVSSGFVNDSLAATVLNTNSNGEAALIVGMPNNVEGVFFRSVNSTTNQIRVTEGITGFRWVFEQSNIISNAFQSYGAVEVKPTIVPTSTNGDIASILIAPTINQTGSSSGIMRGIYYNPTITSVLTSHIAYENTTGDIRLNTTAGVTSIGTNANTYQLNVGNNSISGIVARFQNSSGTCDINPTTTSLSCSSDQNLKKNITSFDSILSKVTSLRPVTFNWNSETDQDVRHPGFIAQEVEAVFPELVATDTASGLKSINYMGFAPYLVKAIEEVDEKTKDIQMLSTDVGHDMFVQALRNFFANVANGITKLFVGEIETKNLCVSDDSGNKTCITKSQLDSLLGGQGLGSQTPETQSNIISQPEILPTTVTQHVDIPLPLTTNENTTPPVE